MCPPFCTSLSPRSIDAAVAIPTITLGRSVASKNAAQVVVVISALHSLTFPANVRVNECYRLGEYHIQFYWNAWPPYREAMRDLWSVVVQRRVQVMSVIA